MKEAFLTAHEQANIHLCGDAEDVVAEHKRRKAMAFQAFMAYMDSEHPRLPKEWDRLSFIARFNLRYFK